MDALATAADVLRGRPVLRTGLAVIAGLGLVVMPFEAMDADPLKGGDAESITEYDEDCNPECDIYTEICCNDPIG